MRAKDLEEYVQQVCTERMLMGDMLDAIADMPGATVVQFMNAVWAEDKTLIGEIVLRLIDKQALAIWGDEVRDDLEENQRY